VPGEGHVGADGGRRRGAAGVHAAPEGVHQHDAGRAPGAVRRHGVRRGREGRHRGDERRRGAGLVERADQRPRGGGARGRRSRPAPHGRQLRHRAHHGAALPSGRHADQVRRLPVRLHHADRVLQDTAPGRGEHEKARGRRRQIGHGHRTKGRVGSRKTGSCSY